MPKAELLVNAIMMAGFSLSTHLVKRANLCHVIRSKYCPLGQVDKRFNPMRSCCLCVFNQVMATVQSMLNNLLGLAGLTWL